MKAILVKYRGPTNTKSARLLVTDGENRREYPAGRTSEVCAVIQFCRSMQWNGVLHRGGLGGGEHVYVWENDDPIVIEE